MNLLQRLINRATLGHYYLRRRHRGPLNRFGRPREITLSLVDHCFARCRMCDIWKNEPRPRAGGLDRRIELLREIRAWLGPWVTVHFVTGEPLMAWEELPALVAECARLKLFSDLCTNGLLLTQERARVLGDARLSFCQLSLHSLDPAVHDDLMGVPGAFDKAQRAVTHAARSMRRTKFGLVAVIARTNHRGLPALVRWVYGHRYVHHIVLQALSEPFARPHEDGWWQTPATAPLWPGDDRAAVDATLDELIALKRGWRGLERFVNPRAQLDSFRRYFRAPDEFLRQDVCPLTHGTNAFIDVNGEVIVCHSHEHLGNIMRGGLREIWEGAPARATFDAMRACRRNCHQLVNCFYQQDGAGSECSVMK